MTKTRQKPVDFIGWKSEDGKLEAKDIIKINGRSLFKVTCTECSKDPELFPAGYFISSKSDLKRERKPCGCSKKHEWKDWQYLILARRVGEEKGFIVHGFTEEFKNQNTKLDLECLKDGHRWAASINNVINNKRGCQKCAGKCNTKDDYLKDLSEISKHKGFNIIGIDGEFEGINTRVICECPKDGHRWIPTIGQLKSLRTGCPMCAGNPRKTIEQATKICVDICNKEGYTPEGFLEGYKNKYSKFTYICNNHGPKQVSFHHFVTSGTRCPECNQGNGNGYYEHRKDEKDLLYILDFYDYIKIGRTFDIKDRKRSLKFESKSKFKVLRLYSAKHEIVYNTEQYIHNELELVGLDYNSGWSTETFKHNSLELVYSLLEDSELIRVK